MYKMLVVDDESWIRERLISTIDWANMDVELVGEACDGEEALRISMELKPDIILTDIRMPSLDGLEFVKQLKSANIKSRVIIISGYSDFEYSQKAIRLGAFDYILKPVDDTDLMAAVQSCIDDIKRNEGSQELLEAALNSNNLFLINAEHLINNIKVKDRLGAAGSLTTLLKQLSVGGEKHSANRKLVYMNLVTLVFRSVFEGREDAGEILLLKQKSLNDIEKNENEDSLSEFIGEAIQSVIDTLEKSDVGGTRKIIKKVVEYVQENYKNSFSLHDVAQILHFNDSYLSKLFSEETGETFTKYLMKFRVEKAKAMMSDPTLKIYEISQSVGYSDIPYFTKMFKSLTGVSPNQYREKIKS